MNKSNITKLSVICLAIGAFCTGYSWGIEAPINIWYVLVPGLTIGTIGLVLALIADQMKRDIK